MKPLLDRRQRHVTATGLFLLLSLALLSVGARMGSLASESTLSRERLELESNDFKEPPYFTLADRDGTVLAWSIETYSIEASPFHLWLGHTPERIVNGLADALDLDEEQRVELARDLLDLDERGEVRASRWPLVREEAESIARWIHGGGPGAPSATEPLDGIAVAHIGDWLDSAQIVALDAAGRSDEVSELDRRRAEMMEGLEGPFYELVWSPQVLLSERVRERSLPSLRRGRGRAARWSHALSSDLLALLEGPREREHRYLRTRWEADPRPISERILPRGYELAGDRVRREGFLAGLRDLIVGPAAVPAPDEWVFVGPAREWVFDGLMPRRYVELVEELSVDRLDAVRAFVAAEELSEYELSLEPTSRREYPSGEFGVLGTWEWWSAPGADGEAEPVHRPTRGLENLGYLTLREVERQLGDPRVLGSDGSAEGPTRGSEADAPLEFAPHLVAGSADRLERVLLRPRRPGEARDYYLARGEGLAPATLETTLDLGLQNRLGDELGELIDEHDAALAMGVVIDLESRDVLALDWSAKYTAMDFPPLQHGFTPGSTFKLITAALALELGTVRPDDVFDVGHGSYTVRDRRPSGRVISRTVREAEGFATGRITAAECVAQSSNAGMIQIGHRVPVAAWKSMTALLGYGQPACRELLARGLSNRAGRVGESEARDRNAWSLTRSHTSVPFGDSITTTLLQHAQAIAAVVHDGVLRPLRFTRAWSIEDQRVEFASVEGERVVRPEVAAQVRAMMRLGAEQGTGKRLERPDGLALHTKTGTTEKLSFDVCSHAYWRDYAETLERGGEWDDAERRAHHRGRFRGNRSCYVSSICAVAPSPVDGRPLMVLVVVDDPHGEGHFGSRVAGPTAVEMLVAGLGLEDPVDVAAADAHSVELTGGHPRPWDRVELARSFEGGSE